MAVSCLSWKNMKERGPILREGNFLANILQNVVIIFAISRLRKNSVSHHSSTVIFPFTDKWVKSFTMYYGTHMAPHVSCKVVKDVYKLGIFVIDQLLHRSSFQTTLLAFSVNQLFEHIRSLIAGAGQRICHRVIIRVFFSSTRSLFAYFS